MEKTGGDRVLGNKGRQPNGEEGRRVGAVEKLAWVRDPGNKGAKNIPDLGHLC